MHQPRGTAARSFQQPDLDDLTSNRSYAKLINCLHSCSTYKE